MKQVRLPFLFFFVLLTCTAQLLAQDYTPIDTANFEHRKEVAKTYQATSETFENNIKKEYGGAVGKMLKKHFSVIHKGVVEDILKGYFLFDNRFDSLIKTIVDEIKEKNPNIPKDLLFFVARNATLNAASSGDGYFIVNIGAFYYLDNEDELSAIISHEIAHYVLKHTVNNDIRLYEQDKSDELSDEISDIKRDREHSNEKAFDKMKQLLYENGRYNKHQELEADSMGYVLYKNTKYEKVNYIRALKLIAEYDTIHPIGLKTDIYNKLFDLPEQPFKDTWLKMEDFSHYDYSKYKEKFNDDSLRSHPETTKRISYLEKIFPELKILNDTIHPKSSPEFNELSKIAGLEQIPSLIQEEEYGYGIYLCLLRLQRNPGSNYYKQLLGNLFTKVYNARKEYKLNRFLERIEPNKQPESYRQFLSFMWNLNVSEIKTIADHYTQKNPKK